MGEGTFVICGDSPVMFADGAWCRCDRNPNHDGPHACAGWPRNSGFQEHPAHEWDREKGEHDAG